MIVDTTSLGGPVKDQLPESGAQIWFKMCRSHARGVPLMIVRCHVVTESFPAATAGQ